MNKEMMKDKMRSYALTSYGREMEKLTSKEKFEVLSKAVMEEIVPKWIQSNEKFHGKKKAYYLSAEFLMGRALSNNLINLQELEEVKSLLDEIGID